MNLRAWILVAVLLLAAVLPSAAKADFDYTRLYPSYCYWLSNGVDRVLEAGADGRLRSGTASSRAGAFWILEPKGDDCYVVTNRLLGSKRVLAVVKGRPVMVARTDDDAQKLRVFIWGDRYVFKRPQPDDTKRSETGDLAREPGQDCLSYTMMRMQPVSAPLPAADNFYTSLGPVTGRVPSGSQSPGTLWRVVAPTVVGRADDSPTAKVVRTFKRGTVLQADYGRGGADEVAWNGTDDHGNAWMRVRTADGLSLNCYIPANARTIRAVKR